MAAFVAASLLVLLSGCGSSPTPEREVERFFQRFNDDIPEVIAQQRAELLQVRTGHVRDKHAARQQGDDEGARAAARELERVESEIRFLEQLDPRVLHLDHRIVEVEELDWPPGAVRVSTLVEGHTLHVEGKTLDLREIGEQYRDWVFTLTHDDELDRWTILDQRLGDMRPFDEELHARAREHEMRQLDDDERAEWLSQNIQQLMQHAVHRVLALFGFHFASPFEGEDAALSSH